MIKAEFIGGNLNNYIRSIYPQAFEAARVSLTGSLFKLSAYVKANKLSGQVLRNRTGRLRRSINASDLEITETSISGKVGTNVEYAPPHEYGFDGTVTVKAHMRMMVQAWGRPVKNPREIQISAHARHVVLPERSFLRSSLRELGPEITADLQAAIKAGIK